jgi:hypothetical protein
MISWRNQRNSHGKRGSSLPIGSRAPRCLDAIFKGIKAVEGTKAQFLEIQGSDVFEGRFANETLMDRTRPL